LRFKLTSAYLDPSFEAMVRCQLRFADEGYNKLANVQRYFGDTIRDDYANGQLDAQVENALSEMKELAIYGV
jgi:amphiphysin